MQFDFLETQDGVLVEVLHTGTGSPKLVGTIKGIPKGVRLPLASDTTRRAAAISRNTKLIALGLATLSAGIHTFIKHPEVKPWATAGMSFAFAIMGGITVFDLWRNRSRHPKSLDETPTEQTSDETAPAKQPEKVA